MNDQVDIQKIKERIAKLLRMADDASSPNEAAIAASRARKLMDKYQLDMLDIAEGEPEEFTEQDATRVYASVPQHLQHLAVSVAKYNDCQARFKWGEVTHRQGGKGKNGATAKAMGKALTFQGYVNDVELAVNMFAALISAVDRLCREYIEPLGYTRFPVGVAKEFKVAAIMEISARLQAMTVERDRLVSENTGRSLVLVKSTAVAAHFGEAKYQNSKVNYKDDEESRRARSAGYVAGRNVEITKSVEMDEELG